MDARRGGVGTATLPSPFPEGAQARHAFKIENDLGSNGKLLAALPQDPFDLTGKTLCVRHYALYGPDHEPPGNIKIARIGSPRRMAWQASWSRGGTPRVTVVADPGQTGRRVDCNLPHFGDASRKVEFHHCQERWCRFEVCAEHDPSTGEHMVRAQWTQVGGTHAHQDRGNCGAESTPTSQVVGSFHSIVEYTTTAPPPSAGGSRYLSHAMVAAPSWDPDFWIGAACEIEGGCPGSASPPEDSDP